MTTGSTDIGLPSPRSPLRGRLVLAAVLLVLGTAGAIGAVFLWSALSTVESLSSALIDSTTKRTRGELDDFVRTVRDDVSVLRGLAGAMPTPLARGADLASQWVPFMRTRKQITAIRLADSSGREYELLRVGDRWFGRTTLWTAKPDEQQTTEWSEWTDASGPEGALQYEKELNYDPRTRPWFQEAMARDPDTISWTSPYIFFTTKQPGITASTRWRHGDRNVCVSVDVTLSDISRFTTGLDISPRGTAVVLADSGRVIGLPRNARYSDPANVSRDILRPIEELEQPSITDAFARWKEEAHTTGAFSYESNDETWWAGFQDLAISDSRKLLIGVVVPEADFRTNIDGPRDFAIAIAGIAFVIALLVGRRLSRAVDAEIEDAADRARRLGQYTLEGRIGEGGMGAV